MKNDPLLQAFTLKHLQLKNRIFSAAHEPSYSENGLPTERYQLYQEEKAKGGLGLTMFGGSALVARDCAPAFGNLDVGGDEIIPHFRRLAERVHAHGAGIMCQITHLGRRSSSYSGHWFPTLWPSCVREPAHRSFPKPMEDFDIARAVRSYGQGARRCREGGLDGVEIQAYGHLFDAFWATRMNRRADEYGGSLDKRMRFSLEVLDEVRRQVGGGYIVGVRMVLDEALDGGLHFDEGLEIARRLVDTGAIDFINVIRGHIDTDKGLSKVIPNMGTPSGPNLDFCRTIKEALEIPVLHSARINDVATARHAIAGGALDLVGMTRAHMADPHITRKIERGQEDRIRPCVGMGYCIDRLYEPGDALCIHNPATGRERHMPHDIVPASRQRRVVVVGAGPAGLEAARVCARRGHRVTLLEAAAQPGGQVLLAAKVERRREIIGITEWLSAEAEAAGVETRFNCLADSESVLQLEPDAVVVATGGLPNTAFLKSGDELVTTTWDILGGQVPPAKEVLVFDDHGQHQGLSCAEYLVHAGSSVEIATPDRLIGQEVGGTNIPAYLKTFHENGVTMSPTLRLVGVERSDGRLKAHLYNEFDDSRQEQLVDQVIVEHGTLPVDDLYFELKDMAINRGEVDSTSLLNGRLEKPQANPDGRFDLFRVGDAVASRNIHSAIYDSLRICKDL
ncbi:MAG: putative N-methylproline demethylase [Gammaproteobacteria bacterium]|nr:putative N-methylproline demethylase [Gammaproteobacteria bacterium]